MAQATGILLILKKQRNRMTMRVFQLLVFCGAALPGIFATERQNILLIRADDLRAENLACYGNTVYSTPYLDLMPEEGTFYEGGVCVPALISYPTKLSRGEIRDQVVTGRDWFPTKLEFVVLQLPDVQPDEVLNAIPGSNPVPQVYPLLNYAVLFFAVP